MSAINVDKPYTYVRSHMELISIQSVFFFQRALNFVSQTFFFCVSFFRFPRKPFVENFAQNTAHYYRYT